MKLIFGLGNPGPEYARTRHNAGFMAIERLAQRHGMDLASPRFRFHSMTVEGAIAGQRCLLLEPQTYMNRSGLAVGDAVTFFKLDPAQDVLIVVDDLALPCGRIRLRGDGSAGGHNGLIDVERALGTQRYPRLRIGIDPRGMIPQKDYVLGRFTPDQQAGVLQALESACDAIECWLRDGLAKAMTQFNAE